MIVLYALLLDNINFIKYTGNIYFNEYSMNLSNTAVINIQKIDFIAQQYVHISVTL